LFSGSKPTHNNISRLQPRTLATSLSASPKSPRLRASHLPCRVCRVAGSAGLPGAPWVPKKEYSRTAHRPPTHRRTAAPPLRFCQGCYVFVRCYVFAATLLQITTSGHSATFAICYTSGSTFAFLHLSQGRNIFTRPTPLGHPVLKSQIRNLKSPDKNLTT
jgi:predicted Rdx family selenoprotein